MPWTYDSRYPSCDDLRRKAKKKIPAFAFEYLDGGCNEDVNLYKNSSDLKDIELIPQYLRPYHGINMQTELFGRIYDAPFGIAPVGLQGLMWPGATEILAKAAFQHNIPFVLSTVTTASIETISEITEGNAWFQLYHPADDALRDDIIHRLQAANYPVLVLLSDVPTFGFRPRDIRNGLAMPPRMTWSNIIRMLGRPHWGIQTLLKGVPQFATIKPYMPRNLNMGKLGQFMDRTFSGRLNEDRIKAIRDQWKGQLVLKGIVSEEDTEQAIRMGIDGIIVSNHGGRQLDAGESSVHALQRISKQYAGKITLMMDGGIRSGPDVARAMASGAQFTFLGRYFMYAVAALNKRGGEHSIGMLKTQIQQIMEQLCCEKTVDFKNHLAK